MSMFDSNDMLKVFDEGITAEQIAKDFQDALNAAIAEKKKADEAAAKAKAEAEAAAKREELKAALQKAKSAAKVREADDVAQRLCAFLRSHYATVFPKDYAGITGADLIKMVDDGLAMNQHMAELADSLTELAEAFGIKVDDNKNATVKADKCACKINKADPIEAFLRKNGLM